MSNLKWSNSKDKILGIRKWWYKNEGNIILNNQNSTKIKRISKYKGNSYIESDNRTSENANRGYEVNRIKFKKM